MENFEPPQTGLIEITNGILFIVLGWMLLFLAIHLKRICTNSWTYRHDPLRTLWQTYRNNKPEIALTVIVGFTWLRVGTLWFARHIHDHHDNYPHWFSHLAPYLYLITTIGTIIGVSCWIRVISPISQNMAAVLVWTFMVMMAIVFGIGMMYH